MPPETEPTVVTGAAGFIGGHFCRAAAPSRPLLAMDRIAPSPLPNVACVTLDLRCDAALEAAADGWRRGALVHLAADAEVLMPWLAIPRMFGSNLTATWNALHVLDPRVCVFASSSSVYGTATLRRTGPRTAVLNPLSLYAHSKAMAETLLRDWAAEKRSSAVVFRFGNIVGPRCRGLIPFLVEHAIRCPDGSRPVELRGRGKLVRDYTPVRFVVDVMLAALTREWEPGASEVFNIGTGRGLTNRQVAEIVVAALEKEGHRLRPTYENPIPAAEARSVVLDCAGLCDRFGLDLPDEREVVRSIQEAALSCLSSRSACA